MLDIQLNFTNGCKCMFLSMCRDDNENPKLIFVSHCTSGFEMIGEHRVSRVTVWTQTILPMKYFCHRGNSTALFVFFVRFISPPFYDLNQGNCRKHLLPREFPQQSGLFFHLDVDHWGIKPKRQHFESLETTRHKVALEVRQTLPVKCRLNVEPVPV